jgi:hypothetical protein
MHPQKIQLLLDIFQFVQLSAGAWMREVHWEAPRLGLGGWNRPRRLLEKGRKRGRPMDMISLWFLHPLISNLVSV